MGRFENLSVRLREASGRLADTDMGLGDWLALTDLLNDAALKIEALEREASE